MPDPTPDPAPPWYTRPIQISVPIGVVGALFSALIGAASAGGVGVVTRDGDLSAVEIRIDTAKEEMRRESEAQQEAAEAVERTRYDEIIRRLDRIEDRLDDGDHE